MAYAPNDPWGEWHLVVAELVHLQRQLLTQAELIRKALDPPQYVWTVENSEVNGYLAPVSGTALSDSERTELLARLDEDLAALQRLTETIAQFRALATEPESGEDLDSP